MTRAPETGVINRLHVQRTDVDNKTQAFAVYFESKRINGHLLRTDICPIYTVADMTHAGETAANKMTMMMMTARLYKLELELDG